MPRAKADANKPRGRMTAYAFFVQTCREEHKKKHPDENVVFSEFSKKCAERWKVRNPSSFSDLKYFDFSNMLFFLAQTMSDKEKKRFQEMAERDKIRFDDEMRHYEPADKGTGRGKKRKQQKDPNAPKRSLSAFFWYI